MKHPSQPKKRTQKGFQHPWKVWKHAGGNRKPITNNTVSSMSLSQNSCKSKVTNLDFPLVAIDKDIVALEVTVYDRWVMTMKVKKTSQNLPWPVLYSLDVNMFMSFAVPGFCEPISFTQKFLQHIASQGINIWETSGSQMNHLLP